MKKILFIIFAIYFFTAIPCLANEHLKRAKETFGIDIHSPQISCLTEKEWLTITSKDGYRSLREKIGMYREEPNDILLREPHCQNKRVIGHEYAHAIFRHLKKDEGIKHLKKMCGNEKIKSKDFLARWCRINEKYLNWDQTPYNLSELFAQMYEVIYLH